MKTVALMLKSKATDWVQALRDCLPDHHILAPGEITDPSQVDYAVVGRPDPGAIAALPNLKVIFSINAGVEALLSDDTVPAHLPLVRMVDHGLTKGMVEWVAAKVLDFHRNGPAYRQQQAAGEWRQLPEYLAEERTIGVLGLGELGASVAALLATIGFKVLGWSRTARDLPNIDCRQGADGLTHVLSQAHILVNLLPLTPETIGLLNRQTLSLLPKGSFLINAARGKHIVDQDLIDLLDDGHLAGAALDVFATEPLPNSDPFWRHPKISITPHVAAVTHARTAVEAIAANLLGYEAGRPLSFLVERGRGY